MKLILHARVYATCIPSVLIVWGHALLQGSCGHIPAKAASSMADIHDDTTVDCFHNEGFQLSGSIDDRFPAPSIGKAVSEKIAWIQFLQKETFDRQCREPFQNRS